VCGATGAAAYLDWPWWLLDEEVPGLSPVRGQWRRQLLIASRDALIYITTRMGGWEWYLLLLSLFKLDDKQK
jgi:hypothetical protein